MVTSTMTGTAEQGFIDETTPVDPMLLQALATGVAPMGVGGPVDRAAVLLELAGIKIAMRTWHTKQPDEILYEASAYSARLTELWTELKLLEGHDRQWTQVRTQQVQPVIDEIDRQHGFAKSRIAMMRQDIDLMTKGT